MAITTISVSRMMERVFSQSRPVRLVSTGLRPAPPLFGRAFGILDTGRLLQVCDMPGA